jgi:pre-mRNA-splicing factor RBM22/SLT11
VEKPYLVHSPHILTGMSEKGYRIASEVNKEGWEKSAFPLLCETCLGDNPYVRMQKEDYGVECKICVRPFTIFRWKAGTKGRYKATIICQSCARMKNVCQTCLFDLEYGLPVQVRDKFLEEQGQAKMELPMSRVGRDYKLAEAQKDKDGQNLPYGKVEAHPMLKRLARMTPYYKRNEARICTFYVKGACNRGQDCPFRHELPEGGELANQKLRDRFHGENDPVAAKLLRRADEDMTLKPPEDKAITTMYVGGLAPGVTDKDVRDQFYIYGEIRSVKVVPKQSCAFVTFVSRESAEDAAAKLYRTLEIKGKRANLMWGRPQQTVQEKASAALVDGGAPPGGAPGAASSSSTYRPYYPSMDPAAQGNAPLEGEMADTR